MKILCIIQCSNLGGMEKVTLESLSILKEAGHAVEMFSLHPVGDLDSLALARDIPLSGTRSYRWMGIGNLPDLIGAVRRSKADRVWLVGNNFGSLIAAKQSGIPSFLSIHYHHSERPIRFWWLFYGMAKRCTKRIHFVSQYILDEVSALFSATDRTVCFPNVFPKPPDLLEKEQARRQLGIPEGAFVVGNAGWLIPRKAFDVFLDTAALVLEQIHEAVFVIAGDGAEREALESQAEQLGIRDSVLFVGWQSDLLPFYSSLDVLLFNSHFDALGRTPVEALASGIPVVASVTNGGLGEFIRHGRDGFLIDRHEPEALAEEVVRVYENDEYRNKIASSGRDRVLEIGSAEKHLAHLNEFLDLV